MKLSVGPDAVPASVESVLHGGYHHEVSREWQKERNLVKSMFVLPLFISDDDSEFTTLSVLPGHARRGVPGTIDFVRTLVDKGLKSVILFGCPKTSSLKDYQGSIADNANGPVVRTATELRTSFPQLFIIADVCLCEYTNHGHCGIVDECRDLKNAETISRLATVALNYARAGVHCVAPSDMNDGRIKAIKERLISAGFAHKTMVMSYSAKFSGVMYGPFREAAGSVPSFGDRRCYQLPPGARGLARRAVKRDMQEGADVLMVKPAGSYLDIIRDTKEDAPNIPIAAYQVSGEYAMLHAAASAGVFQLKDVAFESAEAIVRAGATIIISYFTPDFLDWLAF